MNRKMLFCNCGSGMGARHCVSWDKIKINFKLTTKKYQIKIYLMWVVTLELWENLLSHMGHLNGWGWIKLELKRLLLMTLRFVTFCPVWVLTWAVRFAACEKLFLQSRHLENKISNIFFTTLNFHLLACKVFRHYVYVNASEFFKKLQLLNNLNKIKNHHL